MAIFGGGPKDDDSRRQATAASTDAAAAKRDALETQHEVARLRLVCAALWDLLKQRNGLTEEELRATMAEIDARDGTMDGKLSRPVRVCVQCHRTVTAKQNTCMYCGTVQPAGNVFDSI